MGWPVPTLLVVVVMRVSARLKGNDGRGARRQTQKKLIVLSTCLVTVLLTVWLLQNNSNKSVASQGFLSASSAVARFKEHHLRREGRSLPIINGAVSPAAQHGITQSQLDRILSGELHLVEIRVDDEELKASFSGSADISSYDGVYGTFCKIDWSLHKSNPSGYPMFRDLLGNSPGCDGERRVRNVNVKQIAQQARQLDATGLGAASVLNLTAVVFHESRCGSTLTANIFASYDPPRHRVYSESTPPLQALKQVCGEAYERCSSDQASRVFRDVLYLMSRSDDAKEERVFFKIQSAGSRNIHVFQKAFPTTPYLFIYRDPVQVMMSHLKQGRKHANCVQQQRNPPEVVKEIARQHNKVAKFLSPEDYCAVHLASITEVVAASMTEHGTPVNYDQLPMALYNRMLPDILGIAIPTENLERMKSVADVYSKGRGNKAGKFVEDSQAKEEAASESVKNAAATYLQASYNSLEELAAKNRNLAIVDDSENNEKA